MRRPASCRPKPLWTTKLGPNSYTVTVTATDPAGETDTVTVTITVNNVDEPGTVTLSSLQPIEVGTPLTATLDDPDEREWHRHLVVAEFSEQELPWDPHQWGNYRLLHAGYRRCGATTCGPPPPTTDGEDSDKSALGGLGQ